MESTWSQVIKACWLADLICYWSVYSYIASVWFLTVKFSIWKTCHFWIFFGHLSFLRIFFLAMCHMTRHVSLLHIFLGNLSTDVCLFSSSRCRSNLGCSLNSCTWENRHREGTFLRKIQRPLLKTNISLFKVLLKMTFLFPRWDMFVPRRVLSTVTFFRGSHDYEDIFRPFLCTESYDLGIGFGFTFSLEICETISSLQYHWLAFGAFFP